MSAANDFVDDDHLLDHFEVGEFEARIACARRGTWLSPDDISFLDEIEDKHLEYGDDAMYFSERQAKYLRGLSRRGGYR